MKDNEGAKKEERVKTQLRARKLEEIRCLAAVAVGLPLTYVAIIIACDACVVMLIVVLLGYLV